MNGLSLKMNGSAWVGALATAAAALGGAPPADSSPVAEAVVHRTAGVVTLELANGILIHVKPLEGVDRVVVVVNILGAELMEEGSPGLTRAAGAAWQVAGERQDGLRIRAWPSMDGLSLRAGGSPADLHRIAERLGVALAEPQVSADALDRWTQRAKGRQAARRGPERIVADTVAQALGVAGAEPDQPPTAERASEWLAWSARSLPIEVAVAGRVSAGEAARTLAPVFGALPRRPADVATDLAKRRGASAKARDAEPPSTRSHAGVPPGEAFIVIVFAGPGAGDLEGLRLGTMAAHAAGPRAAASLRSAGIDVVHASVICLPGRVRANSGMMIASARIKGDAGTAERARAMVLEAVTGLAKEGPTAEELAAAATALRQDSERRVKDPEYWATVLAGAGFLGINVDELGGGARAYAAATQQSVADAAGRLTAARAPIGVVLLPPAGAEDQPAVPGGPAGKDVQDGPERP